MKINDQVSNDSYNSQIPNQARLLAALLLAIPLLALGANQDTNAPPAEIEKKSEKGPPLPLHQIEGNGGIFSTLSAYIVNPPREGERVGRPSVGFAYIDLGHGQDLYALTATESPWKRLELGFGYNNLNLGNLPTDVLQATGVKLSDQNVGLYNANARLQLLAENQFEQKWIPALTFGTHFKYNDTYSTINQELGGALHSLGVTEKSDVDFTLYASKLLTFLPRPVLIELGGRATKGVWNGLLGFTPDYQFLFEGNIGVFITDSLILAAEYKQQSTDYQPIPGLIGKASDWWTIDAAYVVNKHFTIAAGYGHFGTVLNHEATGTWGITTKYEF